MLQAFEKYGLISAAYGFSLSHIISRKLSTVGSAEHYYKRLASLILYRAPARGEQGGQAPTLEKIRVGMAHTLEILAVV